MRDIWVVSVSGYMNKFIILVQNVVWTFVFTAAAAKSLQFSLHMGKQQRVEFLGNKVHICLTTVYIKEHFPNERTR